MAPTDSNKVSLAVDQESVVFSTNSIAFSLKVANESGEASDLILRVLGAPSGPMQALIVSLEPGEETIRSIVLEVPAGFPFGEHDLEIDALDRTTGDIVVTVPFVVNIVDTSGVTVRVSPTPLRVNRRGKIRIRLRNRSEESILLDLASETESSRIKVNLDSTQVQLSALHSVTVRGKIKVPLKWFGRERIHGYGVVAKSSGNPVYGRGLVRQIPVFANGARILPVLSLFIIALLFIGVLTKGLWQSTSKDPAGLIEKTSEDDAEGGSENSELQAIKNDFKVQGEVILAVEDAAGTGNVDPIGVTFCETTGKQPFVEAGYQRDFVESASTSGLGEQLRQVASSDETEVNNLMLIEDTNETKKNCPGEQQTHFLDGEENKFVIAALARDQVYEFRIHKPGYVSTTRIVTASSADFIDLGAITLSPADGVLAGRFFGPGEGDMNTALSGVAITLTSAAGTFASETLTSEAARALGKKQGSFEFRGLATPGTFVLEASKPGYETFAQIINLGAGCSLLYEPTSDPESTSCVSDSIVAAKLKSKSSALPDIPTSEDSYQLLKAGGSLRGEVTLEGKNGQCSSLTVPVTVTLSGHGIFRKNSAAAQEIFCNRETAFNFSFPNVPFLPSGQTYLITYEATNWISDSKGIEFSDHQDAEIIHSNILTSTDEILTGFISILDSGLNVLDCPEQVTVTLESSDSVINSTLVPIAGSGENIKTCEIRIAAVPYNTYALSIGAPGLQTLTITCIVSIGDNSCELGSAIAPIKITKNLGQITGWLKAKFCYTADCDVEGITNVVLQATGLDSVSCAALQLSRGTRKSDCKFQPDAKGELVFSKAQVGRYVFTSSVAGHKPTTTIVDVEASDVEPALPQTTTSIFSYGSIKGTVRDSLGNPLNGATVTVNSNSTISGPSSSCATPGCYSFERVLDTTASTITASLAGQSSETSVTGSLGVTIQLPITINMSRLITGYVQYSKVAGDPFELVGPDDFSIFTSASSVLVLDKQLEITSAGQLQGDTDSTSLATPHTFGSTIAAVKTAQDVKVVAQKWDGVSASTTAITNGFRAQLIQNGATVGSCFSDGSTGDDVGVLANSDLPSSGSCTFSGAHTVGPAHLRVSKEGYLSSTKKIVIADNSSVATLNVTFNDRVSAGTENSSNAYGVALLKKQVNIASAERAPTKIRAHVTGNTSAGDSARVVQKASEVGNCALAQSGSDKTCLFYPGNVTVSVVDSVGDAVVGVKVSFRQAHTGTSASVATPKHCQDGANSDNADTTTDSSRVVTSATSGDGKCTFKNLDPGLVIFKVEKASKQTSYLKLYLEGGSPSQQITVPQFPTGTYADDLKVKVVDKVSGSAVEGATVKAWQSDETSNEYTCTTDSEGSCVVAKSGNSTSLSPGTVSLEVSKSGTYLATQYGEVTLGDGLATKTHEVKMSNYAADAVPLESGVTLGDAAVEIFVSGAAPLVPQIFPVVVFAQTFSTQQQTATEAHNNFTAKAAISSPSLWFKIQKSDGAGQKNAGGIVTQLDRKINCVVDNSVDGLCSVDRSLLSKGKIFFLSSSMSETTAASWKTPLEAKQSEVKSVGSYRLGVSNVTTDAGNGVAPRLICVINRPVIAVDFADVDSAARELCGQAQASPAAAEIYRSSVAVAALPVLAEQALYSFSAYFGDRGRLVVNLFRNDNGSVVKWDKGEAKIYFDFGSKTLREEPIEPTWTGAGVYTESAELKSLPSCYVSDTSHSCSVPVPGGADRALFWSRPQNEYSTAEQFVFVGATSVTESNLVITSNSAAIPGPITGLTATETTTSGTISLVWGKPTLNSSALQSYEIQKSVNSGAWATITGLSPSTTAEIVQLSVSGLAVEAGSTIQFRVRAKNSAGNGPWDTSAQISFIAGFSVSKSAVSVSESGTTAAFTVVLDSRPDSNVVISVVSADTGEATVSSSSLTFTNSNWATAQTITVTGIADTVRDGAQTSIITLSIVDDSSANAFDPLTNQTVTATVVDNNKLVRFLLKNGSGNALQSIKVTRTEPSALLYRRTSNAPAGTSACTSVASELTDANGLADLAIQGSGAQTFWFIDCNSSTPNYLVQRAVLSIPYEANGPLNEIVMATSGATIKISVKGSPIAGSPIVLDVPVDAYLVRESDVSGTMQKALSAEVLNSSDGVLTFSSVPMGQFKLMLRSSGNANLVDATLNTSGAVTYEEILVGSSSDKYYVYETSAAAFGSLANLTVTSAETIDFGTLLLYAKPIRLRVTVQNNNTNSVGAILRLSGGNLLTPLIASAVDGSAGTYEFAATVGSIGAVPPSKTTNGSGSSSYLLEVERTGLSTATYSIPIEYTTAGSKVSEGPPTAVSSGYDLQTYSVSTSSVGFSVSKSAVSVSESGSTETFTVVLDSQPSSNVVIGVVSGDAGEAAVSPSGVSALTFTSLNWATAQTVTVTGVADGLDDGNQDATLTLSVKDDASDNAFDSLADQTVTATVTDID